MAKSTIAQAIEGNSMLVFKPQKGFYEATQINKKRWGLIYRGKLEATISEVERISNFFQIPIQNFFQKTSPELLA
jgi:adenylate cyclase class IV